MLLQLGNYNDISKELIPKLPEKGTIVTYRYLDTFVDPATQKTRYKHKIKIPSFSRFYDTIKKRWVEIGLVTSVDQQGNATRVKRFWGMPESEQGTRSIIVGETADGDMLLTYLALASFVKNNPNRDENEPAIFEYVDHDAEANQKREARKYKMEAMRIAVNMTEEDVNRAAILLGYDTEQPNEQLRNMIEDMAELHPKTFVDTLGDTHGDAKVAIIHALKAGTVVVDDKAMAIKWRDSKGLVMPLATLDDVPMQFARWIVGEKDGARLLTEIKRIADNDGKKAGRPKKAESEATIV